MTEVKENDCFAYTEIDGLYGHGECFALDKMQPGCGTIKCPFYKPDRKYVRTEKHGIVYFKHNGRMVEVPTQVTEE